ncbi:MAG: type I secretion system permease/ATPase [Alphaproteobacteria bacterium]|nr:type I secretion system permease/ATPase [Alphaproteobacteria bacterium]
MSGDPNVAKQMSVDSDPLLGCLVFLMGHYGRARSANALVAGLAYDGKAMRPTLFCDAAQRQGLKAQIVKRPHLDSLPDAVLPAVLILKDKSALVLVSSTQVFDPLTGETQTVLPEALKEKYSGYVILTQPRPEFSNPDMAELEGRHWFWSLMAANRGIYAMVMLGAIFINLFGLTSPLFIMTVYDRVIPNNAIETGWALAIGALVVFVFDLIMRCLRGYLIDLAGRRIDVIATRRIYEQILDMKLSQRPKSSGAFANMLREFDLVRDFFTSATITGLVDLPFALFFLFIVYSLGGGIVFILVGLLLLTFVIGLILQAPLKALVRKASRSSEARHGMLVETIHGLETIKSLGADGQFRARYGALVGESAAWGQASRFVSSLGVNFATFLQQIASVVVVLAGMYMVQDGTLSVGGLIACVILSGRALAPIGSIANLMTRYHQASGALVTLDRLMAKPVDRPAGRQFLHRPDLEGAIAFEKVSFSYPSVKREVLQDVSFRIEAGEKVGVIGRIGSGKSTIARLMMGLYEPDNGVILADSTDMRQIDPADLRRSYACVAQDVVLFNASIRENIAIGRQNAREEDILEVAKAAGVHEFVARHPMGYDAPVGERGEGLSGGQRQAIALARAMLARPKVLICDEPTNALDMQAETAFRRYVEGVIGDKTFILITHRHMMLDMVERLILIDQGRVIMDGPREKVMAALQAGNVEVPG